MKKKLTNKHNGAVLIVDEKYFVDEPNEVAYYIIRNKYKYSIGHFYYKKDWELSDYEEKPTLYYIRGVKDRGNEVIKMLEDRGGKNPYNYTGNSRDGIYFIGPNNIIQLIFHNGFLLTDIIEKYGTELHLPELPEKKEDIMQQALRTEYEKGRADVVNKLLSDEELAKIANKISTEIKTVIIPHFLKILAKEEYLWERRIKKKNR